MRRLTARAAAQRGLTLVELMVAIAIAALLLYAAAPPFADFVSNARLRESGNVLHTQALLARSEALKRNNRVRLATQGTTIQIVDLGAAEPVVLRDLALPGGVAVQTANLDFDSRGMLAADASVDLSMPGKTCSADLRCPGLRVDGGGGIRLCGDNTASC